MNTPEPGTADLLRTARPEDPWPTSTAEGHRVLDYPVVCADTLSRCPWALTGPSVLRDHDERWGDRPRGSREWFESLCLEIFQSGLAPGTAVAKHGALKEALRDFHPDQTALLQDDDVDELLLDRGLIRNRAKFVAVIQAARVLQGWDTEDWEELTDSAVRDTENPAAHVAQRLRDLGLSHVGQGTAARFLARTGATVAHVEGCFRS
ncbi:DNA-3-methyladenine glycosylase I [Kocuria sp. JC486]|uniref:DNA-3-methyladenine glycosylase I n=1 Tax=Kocuria sp. JC486 TaxID=1970736 RepID=UPI00141DE9E8|nr:DNA-3-methyladenine glycosylase I [Kocuria sp. JC486]NHU85082.1 DNA-3-methyladenine glycosylase I [Kocuria sp. JC486]